MQETQVPSLGQEDPLEKEMATHSSILTWEIPWTEEPVGATVLGVTRVGHDLVKRQQHQDPLSWGWESYPLLPSHCPLLLLLLSHFSHVWLCATPETQPTRLPRPWDCPGKKTGVGCHFLLQGMKLKSESEVESEAAQSTLSNPLDCSPPGSSVHGIFQAKVLEWVPIALPPASLQITRYCRGYRAPEQNQSLVNREEKKNGCWVTTHSVFYSISSPNSTSKRSLKSTVVFALVPNFLA